jgi:hypothetical protein
VRGTFDTNRILALAKAEGATIRTYKGIQVLTGNKKRPLEFNTGIGKSEGWFAFLDNSIVALGDEGSVRAAIDRRGLGTAVSARLLAKVHEVSSLYDIWGVSMIPTSELAAAVPDERLSGAMQGDALRGIEETSGGIRFGNDIEVAAEAVTRSEKDATAIADVVRFFTGLARMNQNDPGAAQVAKFLESLELSTQGNVFKLSLRVPETELEKMILTAKSHQAGQGKQRAVRRPRARTAERAAVQPPRDVPAPDNGEVVIHSSPKEMGTVVIKTN